MTRSRKGNKAKVERNAGDCWQCQATGQCSKGVSCGFCHGANDCGNTGKHPKQERASSRAPKIEGNTK